MTTPLTKGVLLVAAVVTASVSASASGPDPSPIGEALLSIINDILDFSKIVRRPCPSLKRCHRFPSWKANHTYSTRAALCKPIK